MDPSDVVLVLAVLLVVVDFVIRIVALVVIPRNRKPQTAMAWLLAIFFLPYIGILLFLLLGSRHLPKRRRDKQQAINRYILETTEGTDLLNREDPWPPWLEPIAELNRTLGAMPLVGGNTASLLTDYTKSLQAMTDAISRAKRYVHVEFYIMALDDTTAPFFDALEAAVKRGIIVRVLLDHLALAALSRIRPHHPSAEADGRAVASHAAGAAAARQVPAPRPAQPPQDPRRRRRGRLHRVAEPHRLQLQQVVEPHDADCIGKT